MDQYSMVTLGLSSKNRRCLLGTFAIPSLETEEYVVLYSRVHAKDSEEHIDPGAAGSLEGQGIRESIVKTLKLLRHLSSKGR